MIDHNIRKLNLSNMRERAFFAATKNVVDEEGDKVQAVSGIMAKAPEVKDTKEIKKVTSKVQEALEKVYEMEANTMGADVATTDYVVQAGDTLTDIAEKTNTTIGQMLALNDMKDKDRLAAGDVIKVRKVADLSLIPDILDTLQNFGGFGLGQIREAGAFIQPVYEQTRSIFRKTE